MAAKGLKRGYEGMFSWRKNVPVLVRIRGRFTAVQKKKSSKKTSTKQVNDVERSKISTAYWQEWNNRGMDGLRYTEGTVQQSFDAR